MLQAAWHNVYLWCNLLAVTAMTSMMLPWVYLDSAQSSLRRGTDCLHICQRKRALGDAQAIIPRCCLAFSGSSGSGCTLDSCVCQNVPSPPFHKAERNCRAVDVTDSDLLRQHNEQREPYCRMAAIPTAGNNNNVPLSRSAGGSHPEEIGSPSSWNGNPSGIKEHGRPSFYKRGPATPNCA